MNKETIDIELIRNELKKLQHIEAIDEKVDSINELRKLISEYSPFKTEPVDCVLWVKNDKVVANEYNPNKVAPPEMELLEVSILNDGYTQPIVSWNNGEKIEVVDGFHRSRVGKESKLVGRRVHGYLPIVDIRKEQQDKNDRIASTIRHNRARGKHQVDAMSEIVIELKNRNWNNTRIARELGMDEDEILRLCQVSGLSSLFLDKDFSRSWISSDSINDYEPLTDEFEDSESYGRTVNTSDKDRIFHTYDKWECAKTPFYQSTVDGMTSEQAQQEYATFLGNQEEFKNATERVIKEWKHSCEHYLTNKAMNRIAWMGQASAALSKGLPSIFCSGFNLLTPEQQDEANSIALTAINKWMSLNGRKELTMEEAMSAGRQVEIY
jgi:ParB-like chromosome segregation protein Spo0J